MDKIKKLTKACSFHKQRKKRCNFDCKYRLKDKQKYKIFFSKKNNKLKNSSHQLSIENKNNDDDEVSFESIQHLIPKPDDYIIYIKPLFLN